MGVVISYYYMITMLTQYYDFQLMLMIFGRTDFGKGVSGSKFDAESDFDVRLAVALQKPGKKCEKLISQAKKLSDFFVCRRKMKCRGSSEARFGKVS